MAEIKELQIATPGSTANNKPLKGIEKAALFMLIIGAEHGQDIWLSLEDEEVKELSLAMSRLGPVEAQTIENLIVEFVTNMSAAGAVLGNYDTTESLLKQFLPDEKVSMIMEEIRGPAGRNIWEKLSNIQEGVLANYLKNEYPQTVAVILSKIRTENAARVLASLPEEFAVEIMRRMLKMDVVQKEILERLEQTLRVEFMANLGKTRKRDSHELVAEIFNNFDRQTEAKFMHALEEENRDDAEKIKDLMFTFQDLIKLDGAAIQVILRTVEKDILGLALKGIPEENRTIFYDNMSQRAAKNLKDDMETMGPVRIKQVDEAQTKMVNIAKDLAGRGEIMIMKGGEDEFIS